MDKSTDVLQARRLIEDNFQRKATIPQAIDIAVKSCSLSSEGFQQAVKAIDGGPVALNENANKFLALSGASEQIADILVEGNWDSIGSALIELALRKKQGDEQAKAQFDELERSLAICLSICGCQNKSE